MTMWLDFVAVVLATGGIIEVWQKGSLFSNTRAYVQSLQDVTPSETFEGRFLELLTCSFCESYHVPVYLFTILLAADCFSITLGAIVRVFVYGWAATRASNLIDGLLPNRMRYSFSPEYTDDAGSTTDTPPVSR